MSSPHGIMKRFVSLDKLHTNNVNKMSITLNKTNKIKDKSWISKLELRDYINKC